jgi:hypothetical protein
MAILKNSTSDDTGNFTLPRGTTAQRPVSPVNGMIRFNTDVNQIEVYEAGVWSSRDPSYNYAASGGTITSTDGYRIHRYTSSGTFTPALSGYVEVLVVAGGGGGGANHAGGGGGGGFIHEIKYPVVAGTSYTVVVGAGGAGGVWSGTDTRRGVNGDDSRFASLIAEGGGGGGSRHDGLSPGSQHGRPGGSGGGGGGFENSVANTWSGGNAILGQGNAGGTATFHAGGGGGGAGGAGGNASSTDGGSANTIGGAGGLGRPCAITGTTVYYAGGGGGGLHQNGPNGGKGGIGGGGDGGGYGTLADTAGQANTGGGGGGADGGGSAGSAGGSGIVIVRYKSSYNSITLQGNGTWSAPAGVTSVNVKMWGGGGQAGNVLNIHAGGGGGGAYIESTVAVTPGTGYAYTVGGGGGGSGGDRAIDAVAVVMYHVTTAPRGANFTVQYSDNNSDWVTATSQNFTASACQEFRFTFSSVGAHRYWRYVEGSATASHHPRVAFIVLEDARGGRNELAWFVDPNCSDSGEYIIGTRTRDFASNYNGAGEPGGNSTMFGFTAGGGKGGSNSRAGTGGLLVTASGGVASGGATTQTNGGAGSTTASGNVQSGGTAAGTGGGTGGIQGTGSTTSTGTIGNFPGGGGGGSYGSSIFGKPGAGGQIILTW